MPVKSGTQYRERIDAQSVPCWYKGNLITGKRSEHVAFAGLMETQMYMYDLQSDPKFAETMTYASPADGKPVGISFLPPTSADDLRKRREGMNIWANVHHGFLGRSPDYMNTAIMSFYTGADLLNELSPQYAENLKIIMRTAVIMISHYPMPSFSHMPAKSQGNWMLLKMLLPQRSWIAPRKVSLLAEHS